jgi:hypothetical protein
VCQLANLTGHLDASRTGADNHEGQPFLPLGWIVRQLSELKASEDSTA